jgi:hypothetical protein
MTRTISAQCLEELATLRQLHISEYRDVRSQDTMDGTRTKSASPTPKPTLHLPARGPRKVNDFDDRHHD